MQLFKVILKSGERFTASEWEEADGFHFFSDVNGIEGDNRTCHRQTVAEVKIDKAVKAKIQDKISS